MTDHLLSLNTGGRNGVSPITEAGKIVYNIYKNDSEIEERKSREKQGHSLYKGPLDDDIFTIRDKDLIYSLVDSSGGTAGTVAMTDEGVTGLSVFNGGFKKNQTESEVRDSIRFLGVAATDCIHDSKGRNSQNNFPVIIGGLITIVNSGNQRINSGDWIVWDVPTVKDPYDNTGRARERMPLVIKPLRMTDEIRWNIDYMKQIMFGRTAKDIDDIDLPAERASYDQARAVATCLYELLPVYLHAILLMGIVELPRSDPVKGSILSDARSGDRHKLSSAYMSDVNKKERIRFFENIYQCLGLSDRKKSTLVTGPAGKNKEKDMLELKNTVLHSLFPEKGVTTKFHIAPFDDLGPKRHIPAGDAGAMLTMQLNLMHNLTETVYEITRPTLNRIIAKAQSTAKPGGDIDVLLSKPMCT